MTPEDLERLVALGDSPNLAAAVADLTEPERKQLSKTAQTLKRDFEHNQWEQNSIGDRLRERLLVFLGKKKAETWDQIRVAEMVVLAVEPLSAAKKVHTSGRVEEGEENVVLKIMRDRRPEWIDDWIAAMLAENSRHSIGTRCGDSYRTAPAESRRRKITTGRLRTCPIGGSGYAVKRRFP